MPSGTAISSAESQRGAWREGGVRVRHHGHRGARAPDGGQVQRYAPHRLARERRGQQQEQGDSDDDRVVAPRLRFDELERAHEREQRGAGGEAIERAEAHEHGDDEQRGDRAQRETHPRAGCEPSEPPGGHQDAPDRREQRDANAPGRRLRDDQHEAGAEHQRRGEV
jgi:hypothetical protein